MTGLNLETFLHLIRADLGAWATLGVIALILALMTWTSWGSRRALRKCLVLSVAAHVGLVLSGSTLPVVLLALSSQPKREPSPERIRQIKVTPSTEVAERPGSPGAPGRAGRRVDPWDRPRDSLVLAEPKVEPPRPEIPGPDALPPSPTPVAPPEASTPDVNPPASATPESPPSEVPDPSPPPTEAAPSAPGEIAAPVVVRRSEPDADGSPFDQSQGRRARDRAAGPRGEAIAERTRADLPAFVAADAVPSLEAPLPRPVVSGSPDGSGRPANRPRDLEATTNDAPETVVGDPSTSGVSGRVVRQADEAPPTTDLTATDLRRISRPNRTATMEAGPVSADQKAKVLGAIALSRTTPGGLPRLPEIQGAIGGRPLTDVPEVYRSRLDPNRSALAKRAGASDASEQAVERALDWLVRHQDSDGRWDAGIARFPDGTPVKGDDDYTVHCPPGEPCAGECIYWEADTALTGLALLAFLGSGYTHTDGKYTEAVGKGLDFLRMTQRPDGDLRGDSKAVGMYCHAMASLALCEAYALTGDEQLRDPVERAIAFLVRARAKDGQAWRYFPGAERGDTSILGWVVMALKSAKVVGIPIPASVQSGTLGWLRRVSSGPDRGLASYQPGQPPTPTMTAEAWVCRQFLGVGGPSASSTEAAEELLANGPDRPGKDAYNLYYWYYGTLAMYQYGGTAWSRWNAQVRDQVVRRQRLDGHHAGSWDPDDSDYGTRGGRIYCTALATLTLEVYYRFLRLYDAPEIAPAPPPRPPRRFSNAPARNRS
jgi:hypothetical protein